MLTREIAINTALDFIKSCEKMNIKFKKVILFGSVVKGTVTNASDIDLLLISDQFGYSQWENAKIIARINKKYSQIEAHTYPTEYFLKGAPFIDEVKRTGIELYNAKSKRASAV